jgi:hypothetical protein
MAKNYPSKTTLEPKFDLPRRIVIERILVFSKAFSNPKNRLTPLEILKN